MKEALGASLLKRFLAIVIFLGCATFVAYRQRLSKIDTIVKIEDKFRGRTMYSQTWL